MRTQQTRKRVVRDFARLGIEGDAASVVRSSIVEAAIKAEVTIGEMLREVVFLEAGMLGDADLGDAEAEHGLVPIYCPS